MICVLDIWISVMIICFSAQITERQGTAMHHQAASFKMEVSAFAFSLLVVVTFLSSSAAAAPIAEKDPSEIALAVATPGILVTKAFAIKSAVFVYGVWNFIS